MMPINFSARIRVLTEPQFNDLERRLKTRKAFDEKRHLCAPPWLMGNALELRKFGLTRSAKPCPILILSGGKNKNDKPRMSLYHTQAGVYRPEDFET